jgi:hypothetical protein
MYKTKLNKLWNLIEKFKNDITFIWKINKIDLENIMAKVFWIKNRE